MAAILVDGDGLILIGERLKLPGAWQFPQGGLEAGESPEVGLARELLEEIGLEPSAYRVEEKRGPYRYLFPENFKKKGYQGQEQHYFRLSLRGPAAAVNVDTADPEFARVRWIYPAEFSLGWLPKMKRAVYQQVFQDFFSVKIV